MQLIEKSETYSTAMINEMNRHLFIESWERKQENRFKSWSSSFTAFGLPHFNNGRASKEIW